MINDELKSKVALSRERLLEQLKSLSDKSTILKSPDLRMLYQLIAELPNDQRALFGQAVNDLKNELIKLISEYNEANESLSPIDVSAPFSIKSDSDHRPVLLSASLGSIHPISKELEAILSIFSSMGFSAVESREIDDDWHMFGSLNFPVGHPARDDYDTFMTEQKDKNGKPLIAPAHTSSMQNRVISEFASNLLNNEPIAVVIPGRTFRNEDVDARHEHTFYQVEGVYVNTGVNIGNLIATLKTFLQTYFHNDQLSVKTQPFYFPFTEPSLEFSLSCPFCKLQGCHICSYSGWIELLGCGMIHPNVLKEAGVNPKEYQGFAWGMGVERLIMMKYGIEDIRHFESGKLAFLRQFSPGGDS
jgi:phenylalanyl-tRNA synthetase alpha chain